MAAATTGIQRGIDQHLAFDRTDVLPIADMQTWWNSSPYYDIGIYMPGSPNRDSDLRLIGDRGKKWIAAASQQGWGIIPIWFGLQATCAQEDFPHSFSASAVDAAKDGTHQADLAYASLTTLGMDGTVIYFDLEPYNSTKCGASARAYIGAFVAQMHHLAPGGTVGVYGDVYSAPADFYTANPRPDDFWAALNPGHRVTVWGLNQGALGKILSTPLTDNMWPTHQRMHQYRIPTKQDTVMETWGGAGPYNIDEDIVDSTIYAGSGYKYLFPSSFATSTYSDPSNPNTILYGIANGNETASGLARGPIIGASFPQNSFSESTGFAVSAAGTESDIACPGAGVTVPNGINNLGQIVGEYCTTDDPDCSHGHGFVYTKKTGCTTLDFTGSTWNALTSINDAGWIVGLYQYADAQGYDSGIVECALYKPSASGYTQTPFSEGGSDCLPTGINGFGQIVSYYYNDSGGTSETAVLDDAESGTPGNSQNASILESPTGQSVPRGINNNGLIVGTDYYFSEGYLLNGTSFLPVAVSGASQSSFFGINDDLQLTGFFYNGTEDVGLILDGPH